MLLDSSALVAVILAEPGWEALLAKIKSATAVGLGALTLAETLVVLARRLDSDPIPPVAELLRELEIQVIPFTEDHSRVALDAYLRYGEGRQPAALNFGHCLAYAAASIADQPLLYAGNGFATTDLVSA